MKHRLEERSGTTVVAFEGDLDLEHAPAARRLLLDCVGRSQPVVVDLSGVDYLDSSGVASLVEAFQKARSQGTRFGLVSVSARALRVLELARLDKVFAIHPTLAEALDGR